MPRSMSPLDLKKILPRLFDQRNGNDRLDDPNEPFCADGFPLDAVALPSTHASEIYPLELRARKPSSRVFLDAMMSRSSDGPYAAP